MALDTEFTPHSSISWGGPGGHVGVVQYAQQMVVMFYRKAMSNPGKAKLEGRPVYDEKIFVRIHPVGERLNIIDREATEEDARRFALQWAQFQKNKEQIPEGTPIDLLFPENPAVGATMRANGIHTVEQCANLSAHAIDNVGMGAQRYVNAAQSYLSMANKGVKATEYRTKIEELERNNRVLKQQITSLQEQVQKLLENRQAQGIDLNGLQQMLAGVMQRPTLTPAAPFDAATAQINALSPTSEVARARRKPVKAAPTKPARRQRVTVED